jgi:peptide/nickel transport system permease protein
VPTVCAYAANTELKFPSQVGAEPPPNCSHWKAVRRRFMRHRLACAGLVAVASFYLVVMFADFLAYADPEKSNAQRALVPPQPIHLWLQGRFAPHVDTLIRGRDPETLVLQYRVDPSHPLPLTLLARGYSYRLFGVIPSDIHLFGTASPTADPALFLLGSDQLGRDLFSRILLAIRTSLTIGLVAVCMSLLLGAMLGGISGYYSGVVDTLIQRLIEMLRAIPTIPLWMGLAVAIPADWSVTATYFSITIIISLIGWTELAREIRGRVLALRNEDFVVAAMLCGAWPRRIIFVHLVPQCLSHIIAATTLALPAMIISETALSFLGLGLRAPAISLGVLLNGAQNVQAVALYPWLMWPAVPTALIILAFNFLGDGLRDAANPYG